jgi:hypothetical protein
MIGQRGWCKMQMQKGVSKKGQQWLKKAFDVIPQQWQTSHFMRGKVLSTKSFIKRRNQTC